MASWVTFDCFGTLVDWNTGFASILAPLAGDRLPALLEAYHRFERLVEAEKPHHLYKDVLATALCRAADEVRIPVSAEQARMLPDSWDRLPVFADVEPMLAALRGAGYKLAVLTNCDDDLFAQTQRTFAKSFDMVITAQQVCDYKPSLAHFRRFADLTAPDGWVHVACSWHHDIVPAHQLGITRIWLDRDNAGAPGIASARIQSAGDVMSTIASLT